MCIHDLIKGGFIRNIIKGKTPGVRMRSFSFLRRKKKKKNIFKDMKWGEEIGPACGSVP